MKSFYLTLIPKDGISPKYEHIYLTCQSESIDSIKDGVFGIDSVTLKKGDSIAVKEFSNNVSWIGIIRLLVSASFNGESVGSDALAEVFGDGSLRLNVSESIRNLSANFSRKLFHLRDYVDGIPGNERNLEDDPEIEITLAKMPKIYDSNETIFIDEFASFISDSDTLVLNPVIKLIIGSEKDKAIPRREFNEIIKVKQLLDAVDLIRDYMKFNDTLIVRLLIQLKKVIDSNLESRSSNSRIFNRFLLYRNSICERYIADSLKNDSSDTEPKKLYRQNDDDFIAKACTHYLKAYRDTRLLLDEIPSVKYVNKPEVNLQTYSFNDAEICYGESDSAESRLFNDVAVSLLNIENLATRGQNFNSYTEEAVCLMEQSLKYPTNKKYMDNHLRNFGVSLERLKSLSPGNPETNKNIFEQLEKIYMKSMELSKENKNLISSKNIQVLVSLYSKRIDEILNEQCDPNSQCEIFYTKGKSSLTYSKYKELWISALQSMDNDMRSQIEVLNGKIENLLKRMDEDVRVANDQKMRCEYRIKALRNSKMLLGEQFSDDEKLKALVDEYSTYSVNQNILTLLKITTNYENRCIY